MSATSSTPSTAYALQEMATREEYQPIKGQSCKGTRLRMEERHSGTPYVAWSPASAGEAKDLQWILCHSGRGLFDQERSNGV